jgi:hypothetical protein
MLKLKPNPTFWAPVLIQIPGQEKPVKVEFEFSHMSVDEYKLFNESAADKQDIELLSCFVRNWRGVDAPYTTDALGALLKQYHGAGWSIATAYGKELSGARLGN